MQTLYLTARVELLVPDGWDRHHVPLRGDVEVPQVHRNLDVVVGGHLVHVPTGYAIIKLSIFKLLDQSYSVLFINPSMLGKKFYKFTDIAT